jgi:hypothetical protein
MKMLAKIQNVKKYKEILESFQNSKNYFTAKVIGDKDKEG